MITLENRAKMCATKVNTMQLTVVPEELTYCRVHCSGIPTKECPCSFGNYKPIGNIYPSRFGKVAYELGRIRE